MKTFNKINFVLIIVLVLLVSCQNNEPIYTLKTLEEYKMELNDFVVREKAIVANCVVGYNKGDFRSSINYDAYKDAYSNALNNAETVLKKADLSIADIVGANKMLGASGKDFTSSLWISDRRPLNDAIIEAEALLNNTQEGTSAGQAPAAAKSAFLTAINAAKTIRGATATIERQVEAAVKKLAEDKAVFIGGIVK